MTERAQGLSSRQGGSGGALGGLRARPYWQRPWLHKWAWQAVACFFIVYIVLSVAANVSANLPRSNIGVGFDFLSMPTRFEVGENYLGATAASPVWQSFLVGLVNTARVSLLGIVLCTILGLLVALARLSRNMLVSRVALVYIETVRNIPLLLQMLFWYGFSTLLPLPKEAYNPAPGVFLTNRGVYLPSPQFDSVHSWTLLAIPVGTLGAFLVAKAVGRYRERTGKEARGGWIAAAILVAAPVALFLSVTVGDLAFDMPNLKGFNFRGGTVVTPEFLAVLISLTVYQSGFAAETIRSGILGVRRGQVEAARSLGLPYRQIMAKVVLPQAMRIVVPPMTGQYMSLTKNSSLAVVIGYPELVRVSTAVISETGRAIECIAILMAIYLSLSLLTSAFMNWYNQQIAFVEN